jgi:hypothetical protein
MNGNPLHTYRGAVMLNNMGVALLEGGAFLQGLETLKDAIAVMKLVNPAVDKTSTTTSSQVEAKLQQARHRVQNMETATSSVSVTVIFYDDGNLSNMRSVLQNEASSTLAFPMHIEFSEFSYPDDRDTDLESIIFLYNFAVAHICLSRVKKEHQISTKLQESALMLFNLANRIVCNLTSFCDDNIHQIRLLFVSAMVLNNIVGALSEQGRVAEAEEAQNRLTQLRAIFNDIPDLQVCMSSRGSGAAAA